MAKWNDNNDREKAAWNFCQMLQNDPELREKCKNDRRAAWKALQEAGQFEDMPGGTEVRVFEDTVESSDQLVTIVLPKQLPSLSNFNVLEVWRCTWLPWEQLAQSQKAD